jgi:hypothetical protein
MQHELCTHSGIWGPSIAYTLLQWRDITDEGFHHHRYSRDIITVIDKNMFSSDTAFEFGVCWGGQVGPIIFSDDI